MCNRLLPIFAEFTCNLQQGKLLCYTLKWYFFLGVSAGSVFAAAWVRSGEGGRCFDEQQLPERAAVPADQHRGGQEHAAKRAGDPQPSQQ